MFIDDLDMVEQTVNKMHKVIGVYSMDIMNMLYNFKFQDIECRFVFSCEEDKFFEYCMENDVVPTEMYTFQDQVAHGLKIGEDLYITLVDKEIE